MATQIKTPSDEMVQRTRRIAYLRAIADQQPIIDALVTALVGIDEWYNVVERSYPFMLMEFKTARAALALAQKERTTQPKALDDQQPIIDALVTALTPFARVSVGLAATAMRGETYIPCSIRVIDILHARAALALAKGEATNGS